MPRVIHFELATDDPEQTVEFYHNGFGWQIEKWNGPRDYWLLTTGPESEPGINGAIQRKEDLVNNAGVCPTTNVASVDALIEAFAAHGGKSSCHGQRCRVSDTPHTAPTPAASYSVSWNGTNRRRTAG